MFETVKFVSCGKFESTDAWVHPDRIIDSYEIVFVTKGEVYINENGRQYALKKDDILILQPGLRHYGYQASTDTQFFWLHWQGGESVVSPKEKHKRIENTYNVTLYFRQLLEARIMQKLPEGLDYLTRLILIEFAYNSTKPNANHIAESVAAWIRANRHTAITEIQVAEHFGYNADYLNRLFKANFFKTIKAYINDKRMEYIKSLMLSNNYTLNEIAVKAGFAEYKYFLKFFKYHEKITPTEFYRQYAKIHINTH